MPGFPNHGLPVTFTVNVTGPEYGTTEAAWTGMFQEADSLSTLHQGIRDKLMNEVYSKVKQWQKENYTKPAIGLLKQTKEMDDLFTKVCERVDALSWSIRYMYELTPGKRE